MILATFQRRNTLPPSRQIGQNLKRNHSLICQHDSLESGNVKRSNEVSIPHENSSRSTLTSPLSIETNKEKAEQIDFMVTDQNETPPPPFSNPPKWHWFGGLIKDIQNRYPLFLSDIVDGLNIQCLAAIIFNTFAQISGCIAFGGLMGTKTESQIGISETLLASGIGGLVYSFLAGQPILIVGTTGPLLLFDASLFLFCKTQEIPFLAIRTWIGLWLLGIAIIFSGFEGSRLIKFITRFTQEIFAALISLLFIAESLQSLFNIYKIHPIQRTYGFCEITNNDSSKECQINSGLPESSQPNTALFGTILMFGTFTIAWTLRNFRSSPFLTKNIRDCVANFAPPVAIVCMVLLDYLVTEINTKKLSAPEGFVPTMSRIWFVNPANVNSWIPAIAAIIPAFLLFVLVFKEVSISELIISKKENKLLKGNGLHLDVLLVSLINSGICFFGLPWVSVALVRCLAHCSALTVWSDLGGKACIVGVKEQRLTNIAISLLTGAAVAMTKVLRIIPVAVIFGIFFFMGVASMAGNQFFERISLFFQLPQTFPKVSYLNGVPTIKLHIFTTIQIFWLALLLGIKYTPAALAFPFILIILIPFRHFVLPYYFSSADFQILDSTGPAVAVASPSLEKEAGS